VIEKLAILFAKTMLGGGVAIANFARQFATGQQHPYVWGGTTPRGWDCSGFTGYVYRHFGYNPPRTSEAQYGWVQRTRDQPGAMVFFDSSAGGPPPGHVGISMGGGMMANARGVAYGTVMSRIGPNMGFGIPPGGFRGGGSFGGTVRENQLSQLWMGAGGPAQVAHMAAAIAMAESGGRSRVVNSIGAAGLWQIYGLPFPGDPLDPQTNARMAVSKYRGAGGSFSPWVAFTNGSYRQFMAGGGVITEPTLGIGLRTGQQTIMGERGDETVIPGRPGRASMAGVERRLDRLIAAMEANAGETARGLAGALDGAAGRAANRSRYGTGY
jgi:hypothetical protein